MPLRVACSCGKKLQAPDSAAGKRAKCPSCGNTLQLPPLESLLEEISAEDLPPQEDLLAGSSLPSTSLGPSLAQKQAQQRLVMRLGIGTGALVTLLVVVIVVRSLIPDGSRRARGSVTANVEDDTGSADPEELLAESVSTGVKQRGNTPPSLANQDRETVAVSPKRTGLDRSADPSVPSSRSGRPMVAAPDLRIPNAITEPPDWLVKEANSVVDLEEFFATPPPIDNAAPFYLDAFCEFDDMIAVDLHPQDKEAINSEFSRRQSPLELITRIRESKQTLPRPVRLRRRGCDSLLEDFRDGFEKLNLAQLRKSCVFEYDLRISSFETHAMAASKAVYGLQLKAIRELDKGWIDVAIDVVESVLQISRDIQPRGGPTTQFCSNGFVGQAVSCVLRKPELGAPHWDRVLALLDAHLEKSIDQLTEIHKVQYVSARLALHDFEHKTGSFDQEEMREVGYDLTRQPRWLTLGELTVSFGRQGVKKYSVLSEVNATLSKLEQGRVLREYASAVDSMTSDDFAREVRCAE